MWAGDLAARNVVPELSPPAQYAAHLADWFLDITSTRTLTVIAGMGGGQVIHNQVPLSEWEAWGRLTGTAPTYWELATMRQMDVAYVAAKSGKESVQDKYQALGEYCKGEEVENCRKMFGEGLEQVCRTCPN